MDLPSLSPHYLSAATLDLNFVDDYAVVNGASIPLADVVSYAGGPGRYAVDVDGIYRPVAPGLPRWSHDPISGGRRGLEIEGSRTLYSAAPMDLSSAAWQAGAVTVVTNVGYGVVGDVGSPPGKTADLIRETTAAATHQLEQWVATPDSGDLMAFAVVRGIGRNRGLLRLYAGTSGYPIIAEVDFDIGNGGSWVKSGRGGVVPMAGGFFLVWASASAPAGSTVTDVALISTLDDGTTWFAGDASKGFLVNALGIASGSGPGSLPLTTGQLRGADTPRLALPVSEASWWRESEGTLLVDFDLNGDGAAAINSVFTLRADATSYIWLTRRGENFYLSFAKPGSSYDLVAPGAGAPGLFRVAVRYKAGNCAIVARGGQTSSTTAVGSLATALVSLDLGHFSGLDRPLDGALQRLVYWPYLMDDANLVAMVG